MSSEPGQADTRRSVATVACFGFSLAASALIYPLLALDAGISAPVVGLLTAMSGAAQLTARFALPWLLERLADRALIVTACVSLAASAGTLVIDTALTAFAVAQAFQGLARALFWTSSQTHVVRAPGIALRQLARVQTAGHVGALLGPVLAGVLMGWSSLVALALTFMAAVAGGLCGLTLLRRPPYVRRIGQRRARLWRRRDIALGCWTSFSAGGWRGILDSFVPVILATAGLGAALVGWLVAVAEGAVVAVGLALARYGRERFRPLVRVAAVAVLAGGALLPLVADKPVLAALCLAVAGGGGGLASSLGPAIVNSHADGDDQGRAIALAGTYRAASRLATPMVMASAGGVLGIPVALVLATVSIAVPVLALERVGDTGEDHS